jgi:hypothetical protein
MNRGGNNNSATSLDEEEGVIYNRLIQAYSSIDKPDTERKITFDDSSSLLRLPPEGDGAPPGGELVLRPSMMISEEEAVHLKKKQQQQQQQQQQQDEEAPSLRRLADLVVVQYTATREATLTTALTTTSNAGKQVEVEMSFDKLELVAEQFVDVSSSALVQLTGSSSTTTTTTLVAARRGSGSSRSVLRPRWSSPTSSWRTARRSALTARPTTRPEVAACSSWLARL